MGHRGPLPGPCSLSLCFLSTLLAAGPLLVGEATGSGPRAPASASQEGLLGTFILEEKVILESQKVGGKGTDNLQRGLGGCLSSHRKEEGSGRTGAQTLLAWLLRRPYSCPLRGLGLHPVLRPTLLQLRSAPRKGYQEHDSYARIHPEEVSWLGSRLGQRISLGRALT